MKPRSANDQSEVRAFALAASIVLRGLMTEWCIDDIIGMLASEILDLAEETEKESVEKSRKLNKLVEYLFAAPSVDDEPA